VVGTSPEGLPPEVVTIAGYVGIASGVATAVSQAAVSKEEENDDWPRSKNYDDE